jgi:S1-C subfamily serine protease
MSARRVQVTLVAAALAAALAGCGRDGPGLGAGTGTGTSSTTTVERTTRVEVLRDGPAAGTRATAFDPRRIYRRALPGVVTILATGLGEDEDRAGVGSGFVVGDAGEVVTNAHVITTGEGADIQAAGEVFVRFEDGNQVPARIVGFDPFTDVGLLRVAPDDLRLRPLTLGRAGDLRVGEPVAAIGSPFGEQGSLSVGVISALDRSIQSLTGFATTGAIQTDAAINRGNSGGPLLDAAGRVLGINSQIETSSGEGSGVGFAVAVDTVRRSLEQLRRTGRARYAYLGVATASVYPQLAERFGLGTDTGAWLQEVTGGGPADAAGLRGGSGTTRFQARPYATGGDVVVAVDGRPVRRDSDLAAQVSRLEPGATTTLTIVRDGRRQEIDVRLGERPLATPRSR